MRYLTHSALLSALLIVSAPAAGAAPVRAGTSETLIFVAETGFPGLSLCHRVESLRIKGIPLTSESVGYALAVDACDTDEFVPFTEAELQEAQRSGLIDVSVPLVPALSPLAYYKNIIIVLGIVLFILVGLGVKFGLLRRQEKAVEGSMLLARGLSSMRKNKMPQLSKKAAGPLMAAMCYVAKADGSIGGDEVMKISQLMLRYSGKSVPVARVVAMLEQTSDQIEPEELDLLGQSTKPADCEIILEAALAVATTNGKISEGEYRVVSDIARALSIDTVQFESALGRVAGHLHAQTA